MRVLVSHAAEDEVVAALLKELIERCSLRRFDVWYSSDRSALGGIPIGASWLIDLLGRLTNTQIVIALVTPHSVANPWLYFESGYGAGQDKLSVVPVALGLSVTDIPMPLAAYQGYDFANASEIDAFLEKLFALASVPFDEEMTRSIRSSAFEKIARLAERYPNDVKADSAAIIANDFSSLRQYLEKRFVDLYALVPQLQTSPMVYKSHFEVWSGENNINSFSVLVDGNADSAHSILDRCYFKMAGHVGPFEYLQSWIIRDIDSGRRVIISEIADIVPARYVFKPAQTYRIELTDSPYDPRSSRQFG